MAALNERCRRRCIDTRSVAGPEVEGAGGRHYAAGDRVVFLAPGDGRWVTSERARVVAVGQGRLTVAFDDDRREELAGEDLDAEHLDYAYALTVHRTQAATVDRAHVLADGGGRELAYVAMSRARGTSHVYVVADDVDQAAEDLTAEWRREARQRWLLDTDEVPARKAPVGPIWPAGRTAPCATHACVPSVTPCRPWRQRPSNGSQPSISGSACSVSRPRARRRIVSGSVER